MQEIELNASPEEGEDKYIIHIENFEGPLDLLWALIKKSKIDIIDVSLSSITEQYIAYLKVLEQMNVSLATEFIVMASELLYYKSKCLLPSAEIEDEFFTPPLPPELVQKLLEYKKYQLAASLLYKKYEEQADSYPRDNLPQELPENEEFTSVTLFDLLNAFAEILEANTEPEEKEIIFDEILVSDRINYILSLLRNKEEVIFQQIFQKNPSKAELVATFLAILELTKIRKIKLIQHKNFDTIHLLRNFDPENELEFDISNIVF